MDNEMTLPPRALDNLDAFSQILGAGRVGLFSDFDGTLTPLFDDPRDTTLAPSMRNALNELSRKMEFVAVVSGRGVAFLRETVGLDGVTYVGNHGLEEWKTGGDRQEFQTQVADGLLEYVAERVAGIGIAGLYVENKGLSLAIHYRNAADPEAARLAVWRMLNVLSAEHSLDIREGKMVLDVATGAGVNKGAAVIRLAREFELTGAISLGDDVTDCDAFDALHELIREGSVKGAAVAVVDKETPEAVLRKADYRLAGYDEAEEFLRWLAQASVKAETKL